MHTPTNAMPSFTRPLSAPADLQALQAEEPLELPPDPEGAGAGDLASRLWRLERCLGRHPGIVAVAVVPRPGDAARAASVDIHTAAELAVFVSPAPYQVLERSALQAWVRDALPDHDCRLDWFQMQRLPRAPSGEVLREQLARWWIDGLLLPLGD
jgi:hypothetical protein